MPGAIVFVVCDGLSAIAVQRHAPVLLAHAIPALRRAGHAVAPVIVAEQGRVALGDDIGEAMGADAVAVLIGERPGLTAADSLGVYLTWQPRRGRTDAERNCISNIRPEGLAPQAAADKLLWLIGAMQRLRLTGVGLKDEQQVAVPVLASPDS
jgi:ethanolamine ammonia-lyase small subunit